MIDSVKIGGTNVYATGQVTYQRNAREEREYGQVVIQNNRQARYEMYTLVELLDGDTIKEQYLVQHDQKRELRGGYFEHTLSLMEVISYFDTVFPSSRSFRTRTGAQKTIRDILDTYKRELGFYNGVNINYEEGAYLDKKLTEQEYEGSFATILTRIFHAVRSNPKARYENGTYILYPQPYETRNNLITEEADTYYQEQGNINYATKAKVQAKNATYETENFDWFPYKDGYIKPRAEGYALAESKLQYELDSNILAINKVYARAAIATSLQTAYIDVDITDHVLTENEYDALRDVSTFDKLNGVNKLNCVKYNIDDNRIYYLWSTSDWWVFTRDIQHIINAIEYEFLQGNYVGDLPPKQEGENWSYVSEGVRDTAIKVKYLKKRDIDYTVNRLNSKGMNSSQMMYSQTASQVNLQSQKQNMALLSNRLSTSSEYRTKFFDKGEYIWQLFDYTNKGETVVETKYTEYETGTLGEFELTENFANIKAEESISKDPSPYTITGKKMTTNMVEENYIVFDTKKEPNDTLLTTRGIEAIKGTFDTQPDESKKIEYGVFKGPQDEPIHMALMGNGTAQTSLYHVHFMRPIIAGWQLDEVEGVKIKQPVVYTGAAPTFNLDNFRLYFSNGGSITDEGDYPVIDETQEIQDNALTREIVRPIDLGLNDAFAYTLVLSSIVTDNNIIVGDKFNELLALHNVNPRSFEIYEGQRPFIQGQQSIRDTDTLLFGGEFVHDKVNQRIDVTADEPFDYWAITHNEEIVIAGNNLSTVYYYIKEEDVNAVINKPKKLVLGDYDYSSVYYDDPNPIDPLEVNVLQHSGVYYENATIIDALEVSVLQYSGVYYETQTIEEELNVGTVYNSAVYYEFQEESDLLQINTVPYSAVHYDVQIVEEELNVGTILNSTVYYETQITVEELTIGNINHSAVYYETTQTDAPLTVGTVGNSAVYYN